ncbi:UNVERIFIED_CONTAM: hypothetical protein GTU68_050020 [Idotea baltica]|nr:hypothetical protein [Idotea baltica]
MSTFEDFKIKKQLGNAITDLGFTAPTPIQDEAYSTILSGKDFVGIAQTGTGKTMAYLLPILQDLKYSEEPHPKVLILAPTRELVIQIVEEIEKLTAFMTVRVLGVYGGSNNIKGQKIAVLEGLDIIVGTPRRLLYETLELEHETSVIHSSKEPNHRSNSIEKFDNGTSRILIATDVISRGIDLEKVTHVISFDTPFYPENYIHRIGRTGRADEKGKAILLYSEKEEPLKGEIESLMNYTIPENEWPEEVEKTGQLTPEEKFKPIDEDELDDQNASHQVGIGYHKKSAKNSKEKVERVSYEKQLKSRYKKPIRRGDKIQNLKAKKKKR